MDGIGAMGQLLIYTLWICAFTIPLGLWKLIELVIWATHHVRFT